MVPLSVFLVLMALLGHAALWAGAVNRLHGVPMPRPVTEAFTLTMFLCAVSGPVAFLFGVARGSLDPLHLNGWFLVSLPLTVYVGVCWAMAVKAIATWSYRQWMVGPPAALRYHRRRSAEPLDVSQDEHHRIVHIPGNESLALDIAERAVEIPRLAASLDGLTIVHLSDLHFTGRVGKSYFRHAVRLSNELQPDLVVITGDLVDRVRCMDWIPELLGALEARCGRYVVLGNHDRTVGEELVRSAVRKSGLIDLGGRWMEVTVRDQRVVLAGNELPWLGPAADLSGAPTGPLRIALAHTPDQLPWAQANHVDLLLAGHTHGGQICLPWIGPILTPSRWGVRYSWGTFHVPPTIMNVTRGVSGVYPLRVNCPPEIVKLVLHCGKG